MIYVNFKGLGDTELMKLKASGFKHMLQELVYRSGMCVVNVCSKFNCIHILCEWASAGSMTTTPHRDYHGTFK